MKIEVKIDGMMCEHCEKHMKDAFLKLEGVNDAICDHTKKIAIIDCDKEISKDILKNIVEKVGYTYLE